MFITRENEMRALVLSIVLLVTSPAFGQQEKAITNSIGMKLVLVTAGSFTMGSPMNEIGRRGGETQHEVTISQSYYLGEYEVTQGQYETVMGINPSVFKGAKNPVETVSWDDAVAFCKKLSDVPEEKVAGHEYRLPTEAEWEYACRAGSKTAYCFGDTEESLKHYAWFGRNDGNQTHPVGKKKPNAWGLYDMHGNVWEWCMDRAQDYPSDAVTDPQGSQEGMNRMYRGGCWFAIAANCRSAFRHPPKAQSHRSNVLGFRLALGPIVK